MNLAERLLGPQFEAALEEIVLVSVNHPERECEIRDQHVAACSAAIRELHRRLKAAKQELVAAKIQNLCDVCCASGKPDNCMCGGTGRMSDAALYLRKELATAKAEGAAEAYEEVADQLEKHLPRYSLLKRKRVLDLREGARAAALRKQADAARAGGTR